MGSNPTPSVVSVGGTMTALPAARNRCTQCREPIEPFTVRWTCLRDEVRQDFCQSCWQPALGDGAASVWKSPVLPRSSPKLSRDQEVARLSTLVERLALPEGERAYLLALLLLQRRLARVVESATDEGGETRWTLKVRGRRAPLTVVDLGSSLKLEAVEEPASCEEPAS